MNHETTNDRQKTVRQVVDIMGHRSLTQNEVTQEIGLGFHTLSRFLRSPDRVSIRTLGMIQRWVQDNNKDRLKVGTITGVLHADDGRKFNVSLEVIES